jgi:hypothetical protein
MTAITTNTQQMRPEDLAYARQIAEEREEMRIAHGGPNSLTEAISDAAGYAMFRARVHVDAQVPYYVHKTKQKLNSAKISAEFAVYSVIEFVEEGIESAKNCISNTGRAIRNFYEYLRT